MPTLNAVRTRVDDWLALRWPVFRDRQLVYFNNNSRYWQGIRSHTFDLLYTNQTDAETAADNLSSHPTDQSEDWLAIVPEWNGITIPAVFVCDVYNGPSGHGFVLSVWVRHNGTLYSRAQNYGPLTERTYNWQTVVL